ncbi:nicotinamide riboside kinase 1 [Trichophaea hybrida]|nr:nicotinamide riboside kinase 1 [Trichophaea hybrida]
MPPPPVTFVVGISGLSSSGKTTLSRLLRCIFSSSFILHQDDFFWPDKDIPVREDGIQDWDCVEAINWAHISSVLEHIRTHGALPEDLKSLQDNSPVGATDDLVEAGFMERMKMKVKESELDEDVRIAILDGFLMLHQDSMVEDKMDAKMLLRVPQETAKQRREARMGYVTIEGFWADPPGYFDKIVWPNYYQDHKHLFIDEDVEGKIKPKVEEQRRIHTPPSLNTSTEDTLEWAVDILIQELKSRKQSAIAL